MNRFGLLVCITTQIAAQTELHPGKPLERQIAPGQTHEFRFALKANEYARVIVEQHTVDVHISITGPGENQLLEMNNFLTGNEETAEVIGEASGEHRIRITARPLTASTGRYSVVVRDIRTAGDLERTRIAGCRAFAQAITLWQQGTREARLEALAKFELALGKWRTAGDLAYESSTLFDMALLYVALADQKKALEHATEGLKVAQASGNRRFEAWALHALAKVHYNFGDKRKAVEYGERALPLMREAGDRAGEADSLTAVGVAYLRMGISRRALEYLERASAIIRELQDAQRSATVSDMTGLSYSDLGEYSRALENLQQGVALQRELSNQAGEATALNNIGIVRSKLGEYQKALDSFRAALEIQRKLDRRWDSAINLHNIAWLHANLGELRRALEAYQEALEILRTAEDRAAMANTMNDLAEVHARLGDHRRSLDLHLQALPIRRSTGDSAGEAVTLHNLAKAYAKLGDREKAREHLERSLTILRECGNRLKTAKALNTLGNFHRESGDFVRSLEALNEALEISRSTRDRKGEADALAVLARLDRDQGNFAGVHKRANEALALLESLRLSVASPALRASFFALAREIQELNIEALMRLHRERPGEGFDAAALVASERGRARSLLELLTESGAEIRRGVDPVLLDRERSLQQIISGKAAQQTGRLGGKHTKEGAAAAQKELDSLAAELEQVQGKIRETSPQYAALIQPAPLNLREIQTKVLDADTILLEYALGPEKSYLWAVTPSSVESFELPGRSEIESAARRVYELVTARNAKTPHETAAARTTRLRQAAGAYPAAAQAASRILLGPVASRIQNKRLLIVGEGVLQYLPFAALPEPATQVPLIVEHEITTAPSASVMAVLRQEAAGRKPPKGTLAVVADPVFSADDARIAVRRKPGLTVAAKGIAAGPVTRSAVAEAGVQEFARLRFSRSEAEEIARLAPAGTTLKALDFEASRAAVLSPDFGSHRIIHFATHGLLNNQRPELSGVVLSLVDRAGNPQNGFLRLHDIYNLRLSSDLVVLSACQTGLGGEIKGEGLIGLTRGFLYAGAPRVVASMWEVDDRTTAELMKEFYRGMLVHGERPAAALRAAQVAMWKTKGWEAPYYWAAFALLGEWR
ncbi:MAG: CHAT domain-containing protein [Acidobacteria bacterium]|nr:CHAT domain-containing protein [Acidobacteriota bacterium]